MPTDDLDALASRLRSDPRDPVTIQALADWLEERGAAPESVRALTVDGPTVLVFGLPEDVHPSPEDMDQAHDVARWLAEHSGYPVRAMVVPASMPIRAIRAEVRRDA